MSRKKKAELWSTDVWNSIEKDVYLYGPHKFFARIDFDDVNHPAVETVGNRMIAILNRHWSDPEIPPASWKENGDDDD